MYCRIWKAYDLFVSFFNKKRKQFLNAKMGHTPLNKKTNIQKAPYVHAMFYNCSILHSVAQILCCFRSQQNSATFVLICDNNSMTSDVANLCCLVGHSLTMNSRINGMTLIGFLQCTCGNILQLLWLNSCHISVTSL